MTLSQSALEDLRQWCSLIVLRCQNMGLRSTQAVVNASGLPEPRVVAVANYMNWVDDNGVEQPGSDEVPDFADCVKLAALSGLKLVHKSGTITGQLVSTEGN